MATFILQEKDRQNIGVSSLETNRRAALGFSEKRGAGAIMERVSAMLPAGLALEIGRTASFLSERGERVEEIRLRSERRVYLTVGGAAGRRNLALDSVLSAAELESVLRRMCDGSLYSYSESIIRGYVSLGGGIRVGVCGRAATEKGSILGVYAVSSLNVRLPYAEAHLPPHIILAVRECVRRGEGVLIYSPPAEGKTTLLRSLVTELSGKAGDGAMRVCVIDSREELCPLAFGRAQSADILIGYPKAEAMSIATAFMSPQVIICDEIGGEDDVRAICEAQNCGVPLVASAHGESVEGLLCRPSMLALHKSRAFGRYIGLRISDGTPRYVMHTREEADKSLENVGNDISHAERSLPLLAEA